MVATVTASCGFRSWRGIDHSPLSLNNIEKAVPEIIRRFQTSNELAYKRLNK